MDLYAQRASNIRRTWALVVGFLVLVIAIGYAISWYYDDSAILYIAIIIAVATNFYAYWSSDKLVLSLNHAREATRQEFFDYYTVVENLAITAGLPKPKLYVIDDPAPNAFATGRDEAHAVVCATTGLLSMMSRPELEGVIGHELSHIKNRDMLLMTVAVVLAGFVALLANIFLRVSFFGGGRSNDRGNGNVILLVFAIVGIILAPWPRSLSSSPSRVGANTWPMLPESSSPAIPRASPRRSRRSGIMPRRCKAPISPPAHLFIGDPLRAEEFWRHERLDRKALLHASAHR